METVENLMVSENTPLGGVVNKTLMQCRHHRGEGDIVIPLGENRLQAVNLFLTVGKYADLIPLGQQLLERIRYEVEIFMVKPLRRSIEIILHK